MPIRIEAYTMGGVLGGTIAWPGHVRDALENNAELVVERATFSPLDGSPADPPGDQAMVVDDVVLAIPDEEMTGPVHAAWHAIRIEAGPYVVEGELATMPGFDPGRALTRPTGTFVLLRDVRIGLLDRPEVGQEEYPQGLVNRYTVDAVEADLMLGFFFPGARIDADAFAPAHPPAGSPADTAETAGDPAEPSASAPPPTPPG